LFDETFQIEVEENAALASQIQFVQVRFKRDFVFYGMVGDEFANTFDCAHAAMDQAHFAVAVYAQGGILAGELLVSR
jgi:hypothetical protein